MYSNQHATRSLVNRQFSDQRYTFTDPYLWRIDDMLINEPPTQGL